MFHYQSINQPQAKLNIIIIYWYYNQKLSNSELISVLAVRVTFLQSYFRAIHNFLIDKVVDSMKLIDCYFLIGLWLIYFNLFLNGFLLISDVIVEFSQNFYYWIG